MLDKSFVGILRAEEYVNALKKWIDFCNSTRWVTNYFIAFLFLFPLEIYITWKTNKLYKDVREKSKRFEECLD